MQFQTQYGPAELQLTVTTTDPFEKQVCETYWALEKPVAAIARQFNTTVAQVNAIVERGCFTVRPDYKCWRCDKPIGVFRRRQEFEYSLYAYLVDDNYGYCFACRKEAEREAKEYHVQAKLGKMRQAVETSAYQSLGPVEFNFLVQLASSVTFDMAQSTAGIPKKYAKKLLKKFDSLYLIDLSVPCQDFKAVTMLDELRNLLLSASYTRKGKSIFACQETLDLFRKLKIKHPFVYPEVSLSTFIESSNIQRLVAESEMNLFATCRVTCLICEQDGTPTSAVDYQPDSEDTQQKKCRELKAKILSAIGLPLTVVNNRNAGDNNALP